MDARWRAWLDGRGRRLLPYATSLVLAAWFLLVAAYTWSINGLAGNFISRDQWHFLPLVDHYLSGTFDWHELWQSHTEHVKPGYYLLFLLNARYLGLDMQVETMAGIVVLGLAVWILLRNMTRVDADAPMPALAVLTAGVVLMSFNQWTNYSYGLLSLGGFGGMLAQFLVMLGFGRLLRSGLDLRYSVLLALALILAVWGFSGARSPALVGACLVAVLAAAWLMPEARARILRQGGAFLLAGGAAIGVYLALLHHPQPLHHGLSDGVPAVLMHPLGSLAYISGILTQSMFDMALAGNLHLHVSATLAWLLPLCGYLLLGWCLWRYFRARHWQSSWMPLMLIAYSALFTLEILVGRYGADHGRLGATVPRYVFDAHLWLVGCAWILGLDWRAGLRASHPRLRQALPAVLLTAMLALELVNLGFADRFRPFEIRGNARVALHLRAIINGQETVDGLPRWECPAKKLCEEGLATLKRYHLSVARDASDPQVLQSLREMAGPQAKAESSPEDGQQPDDPDQP